MTARRIAVFCLFLASAGCSPNVVSQSDRDVMLTSSPIRCAMGSPDEGTGTMQPGNGNNPPLRAGPATLRVPGTAITEPVSLILRSHRSPYVIIEIEADGEASYAFTGPQLPELTLNLSGCEDLPENLHLLHYGEAGQTWITLPPAPGGSGIYRAEISSLSLFILAEP